VQGQIHIPGLKKKHLIILVSFYNHHYGVSGEIRKNTILKTAV